MPAKGKRTRRYAALGANYEHRIFGDVLSMASTMAESRKHAVSQRLTDLAKATKDFNKTITDLPVLWNYSDAAARGLYKLAKYVDRTDVTDIFNDTAALARRQPVATIMLGVAAGLIAMQALRNAPVPAHLPATVRRNSTAAAERKQNRSVGLRRRRRLPKENRIAAGDSSNHLASPMKQQNAPTMLSKTE